MNKNIVVVAPHPDDETIGIGGTLLKHKAQGDHLYWVLATSMNEHPKFSAERVALRGREIAEVARRYGFESVVTLGFQTCMLDTLPLNDIIGRISEIFTKLQPDTIYLPYRGDIHSDHAVVFDAISACTKWFRYPMIKRILCYETPSETDFTINPDSHGFRPNVFIDISPYLETKIEIMKLYRGEMGEFPFPRSEQALRAWAAVRGAAAGFVAAEACMLLKELI